MRVVLVYNLRSGSARNLSELRDSFERSGIEIVDAFRVTRNIKSHLKPYINKKDVVIAAYGGDGTINAVAKILANTKMPFAPLPGGTLNHFTKDLGVPQDLDEALANLKKSKPKAIDVACVNDRIVINNSSIGLYPSALQMRDEMSRKRIGKWPAAIIASAKAFWRYRSFTVTVNDETFKTPFVFVGNNDYKLEQRLIGQRERLDQGILSVYSVACAGRFSLFMIFIMAFFHRLESLDEVKIWKTKQLTIQTKYPQVRISRDGEHEKITTPLEYKILPGALIVIGSS